MQTLRLILIGFGNVGQAFAQLLLEKQTRLAQAYHLQCMVTGIATRSHGAAINPDGIDLSRALALMQSAETLDQLSQTPAPSTIEDFIAACPGDVLFENTPVHHVDGQPAIAYLQAGLQRGMHAVTANKGPVAYAYHDLTALAEAHGKRFLCESAVMDGAPIFSLFRSALPAVDLFAFEGILNSCTNLILERMETGETLEEAVRFAQSIGITETDPAADVDGWDAAIKISALSAVLLGEPLDPKQVERSGIRGITPALIAAAAAEQERWKLVCRAWRDDAGVLHGQVRPERVSAASPLFAVRGTSSYIQFKLDMLPGLGILESDPGPQTTAYGLLADLTYAVRGT